MTENHKEPITDFLELVTKVNYFTKLQPESEDNNTLKTKLQIASYTELNLTISSLLKASITMLKNDNSEVAIATTLLLEMALKLLPDDEMELLDKLHQIL